MSNLNIPIFNKRSWQPNWIYGQFTTGICSHQIHLYTKLEKKIWLHLNFDQSETPAAILDKKTIRQVVCKKNGRQNVGGSGMKTVKTIGLNYLDYFPLRRNIFSRYYLFSTMYSVSPQHRSTSGGDPDSCQCVWINFIFLYQSLAFFML